MPKFIFFVVENKEKYITIINMKDLFKEFYGIPDDFVWDSKRNIYVVWYENTEFDDLF